jgi:hypothetical protein
LSCAYFGTAGYCIGTAAKIQTIRLRIKIIESFGLAERHQTISVAPEYSSIGWWLVAGIVSKATQSINSDFDWVAERSATHLHHFCSLQRSCNRLNSHSPSRHFP